MPSSNDSTNPNSPFGVEYGYPQGTRITDPAVVASLQTGNPLPNPLFLKLYNGNNKIR